MKEELKKELRSKPFPIQGNGRSSGELPTTIPWWIAEIAYETYGSRHNQSLERIAERGGFGREELIQLIRKNKNYYSGEII